MTNIAIKTVQLVYNDIAGGWILMTTDGAGREYYLRDAVLPYAKACMLEKKVNQRGTINPDLWDCHTPYGTRAWLIDGMEQRQIEDERFGY